MGKTIALLVIFAVVVVGLVMRKIIKALKAGL